jgi:hypothetical protein
VIVDSDDGQKGCDDDGSDVEDYKDTDDHYDDDLVDIEEEVQVKGQGKMSYILS